MRCWEAQGLAVLGLGEATAHETDTGDQKSQWGEPAPPNAQPG